MVRTIILTMSLFLNIALNAQIQNEVRDILAKRDLNAFRDKLSSDYKVNRCSSPIGFEIFRELVSNYYEGVFYFSRCVKDTENEAITTVYPYRVTLLSYGSNIFYFELSEQKNKKINGDWVPYCEEIQKYRNDTLMGQLKKSFYKAFFSDLNEGELFDEKIFYGSLCGDGGSKLEERIQTDIWVRKKDRLSLMKWLQSTNFEKQVYAVDGLYQLKKSGVKLTEQENSIIKAIQSKKGKVHVCNGCLIGNDDLAEVLSKFQF